MDTSPPRGTSVAHVCLRVNKVQLWPAHVIQSRSSVVLRLWDRSSGRRGSVPGNQVSSHSTSLRIIDTPSSSLGWLRETPTIALSWSLLTTCECILALRPFSKVVAPCNNTLSLAQWLDPGLRSLLIRSAFLCDFKLYTFIKNLLYTPGTCVWACSVTWSCLTHGL